MASDSSPIKHCTRFQSAEEEMDLDNYIPKKDIWAPPKNEKRERTRRITELWPAVNNRRQVRPRSPLKGRPDKRRKPSVGIQPSTPPPIAVNSNEFGGNNLEAREVLSPVPDSRVVIPQTGQWSKEEDAALRQAVVAVSIDSKLVWTRVSQLVRGRTAKQCRERFCEHLSERVERAPISGREAERILVLFGKHQRAWARIARIVNLHREEQGLPTVRSATQIKNFCLNRVDLLKSADAPSPVPDAPSPILTVKEFIEQSSLFSSPEPPASSFVPIASDFQEFVDIDGDDEECCSILGSVADIELQNEVNTIATDLKEQTEASNAAWLAIIHGTPIDVPDTMLSSTSPSLEPAARGVLLPEERPRSSMDVLADAGVVQACLDVVSTSSDVRRVGICRMSSTGRPFPTTRRVMATFPGRGAVLGQDRSSMRAAFKEINWRVSQGALSTGVVKTGRLQRRNESIAKAVAKSVQVWGDAMNLSPTTTATVAVIG